MDTTRKFMVIANKLNFDVTINSGTYTDNRMINLQTH